MKHDLEARNIMFPDYIDLFRRLRSTVSGQVIPHFARDDGYTLAEEIIDMILLHPVNFDCITSAIRKDYSSPPAPRTLINIGPGNALWKSISRSCPQVSFSMVDWSIAAGEEPRTPCSHRTLSLKDNDASREPIAIVGMSAKFPQADDTAALWAILEKGINTVSEVSLRLLGLTCLTILTMRL